MEIGSKVLAGLVGVAIATAAWPTPPAGAAEFSLKVATGSAVPSSQADDADWADLAPPPDPEAAKKLELGKQREALAAAHVVLGVTTLSLLTAAGISGALLLQENDPTVRLLHQTFVGAGTLSYLAGGSLILLAPKPYESKSADHVGNIDVHRWLFYLHLAGMVSAVATGLIATRFWSLDPTLDISRTHPALGTLAIGLIATSATVMVLNF